jgi:membrane protein implicated in regulation of membrane protease activity
MNQDMLNHSYSGQIQDKDRGFRIVIGGGAIIAVLTGALPEVSQIVAASFLCIYTVMTAITGLDPVYALAEKVMNKNTGSNRMAGRRTYVHRQSHAIPVTVRYQGRS